MGSHFMFFLGFLLLRMATAEEVDLKTKILSESELEVIEGNEVSFSCKFDRKLMSKAHNRLFWLKYENNLVQIIAVGGEKRKRNCRIHLDQDLGVYDLQITTAKFSSHSGLYKCVLIDLEERLEHIRLFHLKIFAIPDTPEITPNPLLFGGQDLVNVTCKSRRVFDGCEIIWTKKDEVESKVLNSTTDVSFCSSSLSLALKASDHKKELICRLLNKKLGPKYVAEESLPIHIKHKPGTPVIHPPKIHGTAGATINLECTANPPGYPPPTFRWRSEPSGEYRGMGQSLELQLDTEVKEVTCEAVSDFGVENSTSVKLKVNFEPQLKLFLSPVTEVAPGSLNFSLVVHGFARPKSHVTWTKDSVPLTSMQNAVNIETKHHVDDTGVYFTVSILTIKASASGLHTGFYKCTFSNHYGSVSTASELRVKDVPRFLKKPGQGQVIWAEIGQQVTLKCEAVGFPRPSLQWLIRSLSAIVRLKTVSAFQQKTLLIIKKLKESDFTQFVCEAENTMGISKLTFDVKARILKSPKNVTVQTSTSRSLTIQWDLDTDVDASVYEEKGGQAFRPQGLDQEDFDFGPKTSTARQPKYKIKYRKRTDPLDIESSEINCGYKNPCKIDSLSPDTEYILQVIPYRPTLEGNGTCLTARTQKLTDSDFKTNSGDNNKHPSSSPAGKIVITVVAMGIFLGVLGAILYCKFKGDFHLPGAEVALSLLRQLQDRWRRRGNPDDHDATDRGDGEGKGGISTKNEEEVDDDTEVRMLETIRKLEYPCTSANARKLWSKVTSPAPENTVKPGDV